MNVVSRQDRPEKSRFRRAASWLVMMSVCIFAYKVLRFSGLMLGVASDVTQVAVPGTDFEFRHSRQISAMCEFHRQMTYYSKGKKGNSTPLMFDYSGGYPINCYLIKTPSAVFIRLDDWLGEHLLDLTNQKTYLLVRTPRGKYLNELSSEHPSYGYGTIDNDPATFTVRIEGQAGTPIDQITNGSPEAYIGCLAGSLGNLKFYPAAEFPERKMEHRSEFL